MAEEKTPPAETAPAKKSKKGLIIALASVLVLGGGGAGAYFAFGGKVDEGEKAGKAEGKADKAKDKKHQAEVKQPAVFVELDPPFVANFAPGSQARFLQISVQLMTRDAEVAKLLEHLKPILRNDLLQLFGNQQVAEVSTAEGKEALRSATLQAVRKVITSEGGKGEALEAVYFTSFVMQ
jgi:flagellar FliL protein